MNIFCHKCGKKLETGDEFCQFCGVKIYISDSDRNSSSHIGLNRDELEKKAWYRALKVVYIVILVISVLAVAAISWTTKPTKNLDGNKSSIACNNGKSYAPNKNDIYPYGWQRELNSSDDQDARILCKYDTLNFSYYSNEFIEKNYTFIPAYEDMKYGSWIGYTMLALFILWVLSWLIKIGFFYVAVGEKPKINIS